MCALALCVQISGSHAWAQAPAPVPASGSASAGQADPMAPAYRVGRGDELNFRFQYMPELNTTAVVRSDGRVALPLVGELQVDGLTMPELTQLVERRLGEQVRRPQVVVNVQGAGSQRIFVGGEIARPGVQPLVGSLTVLQAVMAAEGFKDTAQPSEVFVLRQAAGGKREALRVDLAAVMDGKPDAQDVVLQPADVVVVPRSGVGNVGLWVDQYIRRVLPFSLGASYTYNRGTTR